MIVPPLTVPVLSGGKVNWAEASPAEKTDAATIPPIDTPRTRRARPDFLKKLRFIISGSLKS